MNKNIHKYLDAGTQHVQSTNLMNLSCVSNPPKYRFQLSAGSNSLNQVCNISCNLSQVNMKKIEFDVNQYRLISISTLNEPLLHLILVNPPILVYLDLERDRLRLRLRERRDPAGGALYPALKVKKLYIILGGAFFSTFSVYTIK